MDKYESMLMVIDNIDNQKLNSELNVIRTMNSLYSKSFLISEYYNGDIDDFMVYQEGKNDSIMDRVHKREKKDNNKFITLLKFIPRIIIETFKKLSESFKKSNLYKKLKGKKGLSNADLAAKRKCVEEFNKRYKGKFQVYLDEKTGKIKFKNKVSMLFGTIMWFIVTGVTIKNLLEKIKAHFDPTNTTDIEKFTKEFKKILDKDSDEDKDVLKLIDSGIDGVGEALGDVCAATASITALTAGINKTIELFIAKNQISDNPSNNMQNSMRAITDFNDALNKICLKIAVVTGAISLISDITGFFNGFAKSFENMRHYTKFDNIDRWLSGMRQPIIEVVYSILHPQTKGESETDYYVRLSDYADKAVLHDIEALGINTSRGVGESADDYEIRKKKILCDAYYFEYDISSDEDKLKFIPPYTEYISDDKGKAIKFAFQKDEDGYDVPLSYDDGTPVIYEKSMKKEGIKPIKFSNFQILVENGFKKATDNNSFILGGSNKSQLNMDIKKAVEAYNRNNENIQAFKDIFKSIAEDYITDDEINKIRDASTIQTLDMRNLIYLAAKKLASIIGSGHGFKGKLLAKKAIKNMIKFDKAKAISELPDNPQKLYIRSKLLENDAAYIENKELRETFINAIQQTKTNVKREYRESDTKSNERYQNAINTVIDKFLDNHQDIYRKLYDEASDKNTLNKYMKSIEKSKKESKKSKNK